MTSKRLRRTATLYRTTRRVSWIGLLVLSGGCTRSGEPGRTPVELTDARGRTVHVALPVSRIVPLAPSATEIAFTAAGGAAVFVSVTTADDYPPEIAGLPRISALPLDMERLVALAPDLVLATEVNRVEDADRLTDFGIPVYFLASSSLEDVFSSLETVGSLVGRAEAASRHAQLLRRTVAALEARTSVVEHPPDVLFLIDDRRLHAFGAGSYIHDLIELAGGESITASLEQPAPILSDEFVLSSDPEIIVGAFGDAYDPDELLEHHPSWTGVSAVVSGRVYSVDPDIILRPGPRLVNGLFRLAALIQPEIVATTSFDVGASAN